MPRDYSDKLWNVKADERNDLLFEMKKKKKRKIKRKKKEKSRRSLEVQQEETSLDATRPSIPGLSISRLSM